MKNRKPNPIEEELGIEPVQVNLEPVDIKSEGIENDRIKDYEFMREKIYHSVIRGTELVDAITREMVANPSGIGVQSAAQAVKALTDNSYRLFELHEKMKKLSETSNKDQDNSQQTKSSMSFSEVLRVVEGGKKNP